MVTKPAHGDLNWDVPLNAALDNLQAQITAQAGVQSGGTGLGWTSVVSKGAIGNGVADDTAAIQAAIAALPASGGVVYFPPGKYMISAPLMPANGTANIILMGAGGRNAGNAGNAGASRIVYTATGSDSALNFGSTAGTQIRNLCIEHTSTTYSGRLIDLRNTTGSDSAYSLVEDCYLAGPTGSATATGIDLDRATRVTISRCAMYAFGVCISGKSVAANYSNQVRIVDCGFNKSTWGIRNPGQAWLVESCCGEASASGVAGFITHDAGVYAEALTVTGCWTGDATSGTQITIAGNAINIIGNWLGATGGTAIKTDDVTTGLIIRGNELSATTAINIFTSASNSGFEIGGNFYRNVTTKLAGTLPAGSLYGDGGGFSATAPLVASATLTWTSIAAGAMAEQVVSSVTGATTSMAAIASPLGSIGNTFIWAARVSNTNSVVVRVVNVGSVAATPSPTTWQVRVIQ